MTTMSGTHLMVEPHLGFGDKLTAYVAWALAGAIFFTVGWTALAPVDPLGAVSLYTGRSAIGMLIQASLLAIVAAGIGTVMIGRKLPDAGTFAASLGLAVVSLRGGTMESLLLMAADNPETTRTELAIMMALETVGWGVVAAVAVAASAILTRWMFRETDGRSSDKRWTAEQADLAGWDIPLVGALLGRPGPWYGTSAAEGVRHTALATVMILLSHLVFATGLENRAITHGQACFVVVSTVCVGVYFAFRFAPVRSALWPLLAVLVSSILSYVIAAVTERRADASPFLPPNIPASHFLRVLPVQRIAVGCAAAVAAFWWRWTAESAARTTPGGEHGQPQ